MIDNLALGLSHGLMILAAWRLLTRPDLDDAAASPPPLREESKSGWPEAPRDA
jgi:hypothetical protein